jgi:hypothetical protein
MPDPKLLWFHSKERRTVYVEGQTFAPDDEGYIAVPENLGSRIMVIPGFTYIGRERGESHEPEQLRFATARSGRPEEFAWDDIWIEICRQIYEGGVPATAAELMRHVQGWCEIQFGKQPGDSTLKPKLRKLFVALRPDEN